MNQHLTRLVEARLHYFASVGAILAERHFDRPNCLMEAVLGHWTHIREIAHAETDEQGLQLTGCWRATAMPHAGHSRRCVKLLKNLWTEEKLNEP